MDKKLDYFIKILDTLNKSNGYNLKIQKNVFLKDIYTLNLLLYKLYKIYKTDKTRQEKIKSIYNLKIDGSKFLSKQQATMIHDKFASNLVAIYDKIYSLQYNSFLNKKDDVMYGGSGSECMNSYIDTLIDQVDNFNIDKSIEISNMIFNWIFFPLWSFENLPFVGEYIELPLDIMGNILDNIDVVADLIAPVLPIIIDIGLDVAQGIPAVGTAVTPFALGFNFLEEPLEYFVSDGSDLIGMFINISRKQWGLAYISALSAIPNFAELVDSTVSGMYTANKWLKRVNDKSGIALNTFDKINKNIQMFTPIMSTVLADPYVILDPLKILDKIILPNRHKIPYLKDLSQEEVNTLMKNISETRPIIEKLKKDPMSFIKNPEKFYQLFMKYRNSIPGLLNLPIKDINLGVKYTNNVLKKMNMF